MKKISVFIILVVLLFPVHVFARENPYSAICQTLPASAPISITLREIGYQKEKTYIGNKFYNKNEVITEPAKIYIRNAVRNNSKKTITSCYYSIKVCSTLLGMLDNTIYEGNIILPKCKIGPRRTYAETKHEQYNEGNKYHLNINKGLADHISKIIYKVYFVKYSDGTSESFNPDL